MTAQEFYKDHEKYFKRSNVTLKDVQFIWMCAQEDFLNRIKEKLAELLLNQE